MRIAKSLVCVCLGVCSGLISLAAGQAVAARANSPSATAQADVGTRAESILSQMTLQEKIDYIGGYKRFYIRPIPRLGLPQLKMSDGPVGVRTYGPATAMPAGIAMAASWDTELANRVGVALGQDARARGVHFLLAPGMNIYRAPMCGRNCEYFGEDPFLASRMAVADIQGIQSQGVSATAKHFVANNEEWDRHTISSDLDERTLREIYLPAFEASVKEGHVAAIMDSYNLVNGTHMTQNAYLNSQVAKREWGFSGIIMSDWDATYDGIAAVNSGLDLEMPLPKLMNPELLLSAVKDGRVSEATIDDHVRRILRTAVEFGWLDREQTDRDIPLDNPKARAVALDAALGSMVLLKNGGNVLPLDKSKLKTVAVIGPLAARAITGGGGSSHVETFESSSFLKGIQDYAGNSAKILYAEGAPTPAEHLGRASFRSEANGGEPGLKAEYFNNSNLEGTPALVRVDRQIDFRYDEVRYAPGAPKQHFSARWTGYYIPATTSDYQFYVYGSEGYRVYIDDQRLISQWREQQGVPILKSVKLEARRIYKIRVEYHQNSARGAFSFAVDNKPDTSLQQAKELASKADVVILCTGFTANTEFEGADRTYQLPGGQDQLIREIEAVNKNTIVILTAGGSVKTDGWIVHLAGFIHAWYPGQEGGVALAKILFGEVSPSGKLPITFERRWEDAATVNSYYDDPTLSARGEDDDAPRNNGAVRGHVAYKEGLFLGYRYFDASGTKPLFPFGYGLSYTTFKVRTPQDHAG